MNKKGYVIEQDCVTCVSAKQASDSYKSKLAKSFEGSTMHIEICTLMASRSHG